MSFFYFPGAYYTVDSRGNLSFTINGIGTGSGRLTSQSAGYVTFFGSKSSLIKVADKGSLRGTWSGDIGPYSISFEVDENGEVKNFTGIQGPTTGRLFKAEDTVAGFFRTGLPDKDENDHDEYKFNQVGIKGELKGDRLIGEYEVDKDEPLKSFTLIRQDDHPNGLTDLQKANIILNWLEPLFPELIKPTPQETQEISGIIFRHYPTTNVYIATFQNHLYFIDNLGNVHDLGTVDYWLPIAQAGYFF